MNGLDHLKNVSIPNAEIAYEYYRKSPLADYYRGKLNGLVEALELIEHWVEKVDSQDETTHGS